MKVSVIAQDKKYTYSAKLIRAICAELFDHFDVCPDYELAVYFCSEAKMKRLNLEYRGKNKATDVLSFAVNDGEKIEKRGGGSGVPMLLGDIFLCPGYIIKNNVIKGGSPLREETAYLLIHGFMHLIGYDHDEDGFEGSKMRRDADRFIASKTAGMNIGSLIKISKG